MTLLLLSAMKRLPALSTAMPTGVVELGAGGRAAVAAVAETPFPATVEITPAESTSRTTLLPLSAMKRSPAGSTATAVG